MAESGFATQNRGILTALRAAAIVIIATGLNDVLAGALPRYEPLYLYLAAIAFVVWLDGLLLGILTAAVAIGFYALLFLPRNASLVVPAIGAAAALIVVVTIRGFLRARRRHEPEPRAIVTAALPPLLPPVPMTMDHAEVLSAIDELREEVRSAVRQPLDTLRAEYETARAELAKRDAEITALRTTMRARVGDLEQARTVDASRIAELEDAMGDAAALRIRVSELEEALASAQVAHDTALANARTTHAAALRTHLEQERRAHEVRVAEVTAALATARATSEALRTQLEQDRTTHEARVAELTDALANARATSEARNAEATTLRARIAELERVNAAGAAALRTQLAQEQAEHEARVAEVNAALATARATSEALRAQLEQDRTTHEVRVAELTDALANARATSEAGNAEATTLRARIAELERAHTASAAALRTAVEQERAAHEARLAELTEALAKARTAIVARDAEATTLRARIDELERAHTADAAALRTQLEQERAAHEARVTELTDALATARAASDAREAEAAALRAELEAAFDQKLNTIVAHLAEDHETDLGKAVEEREEARAEARNLTMRLATTQKKLDEERQRVEDLNQLLIETRRAAQKEIDALRAQTPRQEETKRPRILIAHPDADLRTSARASLERAGYEIVSAADGLEALRTAIAQQPHVVIADALMPKMDGRELCQLLKSQEKTAHIRVILLMRAADDPPKGDLLPDEVLRKPVPLETLKHTLATLLSARA